MHLAFWTERFRTWVAAKTLGRRLIAVALSGLMVVGLTSCSLDQFRASAARTSQLVVSFSENPKTFNASLSAEQPSVFSFIYEGLLSENGLTGELEPALAESWEISEDDRTIVFTLREDLRWSDGELLTAEDFAFTFNDIYYNEAIPVNGRDGLRVGTQGLLPEIKALDSRRLQVVSPEPFAPLLRTVGQIAPMPQHILAETIEQKDGDGNLLFLSTWGVDADPQEIIANGPYVMTDYQPNERLVFERNPYYWRKDSEGNAMPYIERVVRPILTESDASLLQFRSGGLDAQGVSPANYSLLKKEEERGDFTIYIGGPASGISFFMLNLNKGSRSGVPLVDPIKSRWFNTVAFRQAIAYAIDRGTMINNLYRGIGAPQYSPITVQSPYFLSPEEGLKVYDYDPEKAKDLLKQAGFTSNSQGQLVDAEGNQVRFTFTTYTGSPTVDQIAAQIKQDLGAIGIQVDLQFVTFSTLVDKIDNTMQWECLFLGFTGGVEPNGAANLWLPEGRLHMFNLEATAGQEPIEGREVADWERQIGDLYIRAAQELDETKRKAIYAEFQQLALEYLPLIYAVNPIAMAAVRNKVKGVEYSALNGSALWNIYELKIEAAE
ncbi:MAG: ABC transporter substrate-binding protein [Leptolyngbyaceae cyanobacterium SL_1_1]|nr:ABC transporter substrate-binding protein [Leptolyngbyaceae cyanobacterium RM1_1_2]NJO08892.1 ABC transporter substrate-binding protein [Leptolyngbyaceae cyanobacterium SL_1_1]